MIPYFKAGGVGYVVCDVMYEEEEIEAGLNLDREAQISEWRNEGDFYSRLYDHFKFYVRVGRELCGPVICVPVNAGWRDIDLSNAEMTANQVRYLQTHADAEPFGYVRMCATKAVKLISIKVE